MAHPWIFWEPCQIIDVRDGDSSAPDKSMPHDLFLIFICGLSTVGSK